MWDIQKNREKDDIRLREQFEHCKAFIEESISKCLEPPYRCSAMYESIYRYDISQGFAGWVCRIYSTQNQAFYDVNMDRITEDNIEKWTKYATDILSNEFNGDVINEIKTNTEG